MTRKMRWVVIILTVVTVLAMTMPNVLAAGSLLRKGDQGSDVKKIQTRLKDWGYYGGSLDGKFGPVTEKAVRKFQSRNGLSVDGIVGPRTAAAIGITLAGGSTTASNSSLNLLARVVYAESRGEPYAGKVAVAAVVLNRVDSSQFPNTISGVVYQKNAFSCVSDGQINKTPDSEAYQAARDALNGSDPSNGALYYYNPNIATSSWIFTRKVVKVIGDHRFAV